MRRLLTQLEELPASQFVLQAGVTGGLIEGLSLFLVAAFRSSGTLFVPAILGVTFAALWYAAAIIFCFVAIRRRQHSVLVTALHLALALAIVHLIQIGFALGLESAATHGELVTMLMRTPLDSVASQLIIPAIRFPADLLLAALVVALGRYLFQQRSDARPQPTNPA